MSRDFTGGYGPEEFILRKSMKGEYIVQIHYYGDSQQSVEGPTTVQLEMYTNYGFKNQKVNKVTRRLSEPSEGLQIGSFVVE